MKIISIETKQLIEKIIIDCGLEDEFIKKDLILKEKLENAKDLEDRIALKIFFSKEIQAAFNNKKPLSDVLASFAISEGLRKILNKKLDSTQFPIFLQNKLKINFELANKISDKILNSESFKKDLMGDNNEEDLNIPSLQNKIPRGIGQELI